MESFLIRKFNDPILRKKTKKVKLFDRELEWLVLAMKKTMIEKEGIGLAAPQIGENRQVIVFMDITTGEIKELINPIILKYGKEKDIQEEGCLSFPGVYLKIKRSLSVEIEGFDVSGRKIKIKAEGFLARILQHEIDHLNGVLFFDYLSFFKKIIFRIKVLKPLAEKYGLNR